MQKKNIEVNAVNGFTTVIVILLPLLHLNEMTKYIENVFHLKEINSIELLILGTLVHGLLSIYILFSILKVICIYCKLKIDTQVIYSLLITSKLMISLLNSIAMDIQISINLFFSREFGFGVLFSLLLYFYLEYINKLYIQQYIKIVIVLFIVLFILNVLNVFIKIV